MNKYKKLLTDTGLFTISSFASKLLVFLLLPLYTNVLTTEEYAIADLITTTINLIFPILTLSISEATLRFAFDMKINKNEVLSSAIMFVVLSTLLLCIIKPIINSISITLYNYWWYFVLCYLATALHNVFSYFSRGCDKTRIFAVSGIIHTVILVGCNILFLLCFKIGLEGYLISMILSFFVSVFYIIVRAPFTKELLQFHLNKKVLAQMLKYSIPMIPTIIAWWFMQTSDKYMIIWKLGLSQSGIYSVSYKIPSILTIISSIFTQAWQISAITNYGQDDNQKFVGNVYLFFNMVSVMACSALIFMSKVLGGILFAKDYFIAWKCVPILLIAYVFSGLSGFLASNFTASKKTNYLFISTSVGAAVNVLLNLVLIDKMGVQGAAYTTLIGFLVTWMIRLYVSQKIVKINIPLKKHGLTYILLLIDAIYVYNEFPSFYIISAVIFGVLFGIYLPEIKVVFIELINIAKKILHRV